VTGLVALRRRRALVGGRHRGRDDAGRYGWWEPSRPSLRGVRPSRGGLDWAPDAHGLGRAGDLCCWGLRRRPGGLVGRVGSVRRRGPAALRWLTLLLVPWVSLRVLRRIVWMLRRVWRRRGGHLWMRGGWRQPRLPCRGHLEAGPCGPHHDFVVVPEKLLAVDPCAVDERAVQATAVAQHVLIAPKLDDAVHLRDDLVEQLDGVVGVASERVDRTQLRHLRPLG
jgi:hypothetical protein